MPIMDEDVYDTLVESASHGDPPDIRDTAVQMFNYTSPWFWEEHYYPYVELIGKTREKILLEREIARSHAKTSGAHVIALHLACFVIPYIPRTRAENRRILIIGRDEQHAKDIVAELDESICTYAPWLKFEDWKLRGDAASMKGVAQKGNRTWNKLHMTLTNGVEIRGFSIEQSVRRFHCFLAILDDLITEQNWAQSDEYVELIESSVLKAIEFGGLVLLQGTPQDESDALAQVAADPKWNAVSLPGQDEEYIAKNIAALESGALPPHPDGKEYTKDDLRCLWPWRMDALQHKFERGKTRESQLRYEREIMMERVTVASSLIRIEDIYAARDPTLHYIESAIPTEDYAGGADPSALSRSDAAMCMGTSDKDSNIVVRHFTVMEAQGKGRSEDSTLHVVEGFNHVSTAFRNPLTFVEQNQYQEMIKPVSKHLINPSSSFRLYHLGGQKHTESGWVGVRTVFANRRVRLPYGPTPQEKEQIEAGILDPDDIQAKKITDKFIRQLTTVRKVKDRVETPKGRKDDMVSAFFLMTKAWDVIFGDGGDGTGMSESLPSATPQAPKRPEGFDPELDDAPVSRLTPAQAAIGRMQRFSPRRRV